MTTVIPTTSHWGAYGVRVVNDEIVEVIPHPADPDPSPLLDGVAGAARHRTRIQRPAIRRGWLEHGAGPTDLRGRDEFVEVSWGEAIEAVATELNRARDRHGNESIFGGSYGWASAGIFHHSQTQLQRLLNLIGGYTRSINSYSNGTSVVLLPHVVGSAEEVMRQPTSWPTIIEHTELVVAFGGIPAKNVFVTPGGMTQHRTRDYLDRAASRGVEFALVSPVRNDLSPHIPATWYPVVPGTDVALMLALAHTLLVENLADRAFLDRYTFGADIFESYVVGTSDGVAKDAEWASTRCQIPADEIRQLARRMAAVRTLVTVTWSLQRIPHGEQPVWAGLALAALLGQIGLPGGGFGHGYGSMGDVGSTGPSIGLPHFSKGRNKIRTFIPVARIADMLLSPGEEFAYDGGTYTYPDIRLVYWAGGNPFHHHQDLNRLARAWARPDTVVVHEQMWNANARMADIVLPATSNLERNDIGHGVRDALLIAMKKLMPVVGESRDDYEIFADIAQHMGQREAFTEGRDSMQWLEFLYAHAARGARTAGVDYPEFKDFWATSGVRFPPSPGGVVMLDTFRADPVGHPLQTPSGRIELFSERIASFAYADCPGHPTWLEPAEWLGAALARQYPLHMISDQPYTKLHSQLDHSSYSLANKVAGREPVHIHPHDATARGIGAGDVVRLFNGRGACLAGAVLDADLRIGVVKLSTGAWWDPDRPGSPDALDRHGNPNALTRDVGASSLSQGCSAQTCLVELERYAGTPPAVRVFTPPVFERP